MNEDSSEGFDDDIGWIPDAKSKDPYRMNMIYVLQRYKKKGRVGPDGRIKFKLPKIMAKFGDAGISSFAFVHKQDQKCGIISRLNEFPPYSVSAGKDGIDIDGDEVFYYELVEKDGGSRSHAKDVKPFDEGSEKQSLKIGNAEVKDSILEGADIVH